MDKTSWQIPKKAFLLLQRNDPLRMAGATAFFTSFSLPFIIIILIQLFGLVLDRHKLSQQLFHSLSEILGTSGEQQIRDISRGFRRLATNWWFAAGGFIFLLFVVTTLFKVIKDSIHQLWRVEPTASKWSASLLPRLKAVGLIVLIGILFLLDVAVEGFLTVFRYAMAGEGALTVSVVFTLVEQLISFVIFTAWILCVLLYLPDARFSFPVTAKGALLTGALFTTGKWLLRWLLVSSNVQRVYGSAGAFVVVLLFVFYMALILYYGAAFTAVIAERSREALQPRNKLTANRK
jgi:membrane protein